MSQNVWKSSVQHSLKSQSPVGKVLKRSKGSKKVVSSFSKLQAVLQKAAQVEDSNIRAERGDFLITVRCKVLQSLNRDERLGAVATLLAQQSKISRDLLATASFLVMSKTEIHLGGLDAMRLGDFGEALSGTDGKISISKLTALEACQSMQCSTASPAEFKLFSVSHQVTLADLAPIFLRSNFVTLSCKEVLDSNGLKQGDRVVSAVPNIGATKLTVPGSITLCGRNVIVENLNFCTTCVKVGHLLSSCATSLQSLVDQEEKAKTGSKEKKAVKVAKKGLAKNYPTLGDVIVVKPAKKKKAVKRPLAGDEVQAKKVRVDDMDTC